MSPDFLIDDETLERTPTSRGEKKSDSRANGDSHRVILRLDVIASRLKGFDNHVSNVEPFFALKGQTPPSS